MMIGSGIERSQKSGWSIGSCRVFSTYSVFDFFDFSFLNYFNFNCFEYKKERNPPLKIPSEISISPFSHFLQIFLFNYFYTLYIFLKNEIELEIIGEKK